MLTRIRLMSLGLMLTTLALFSVAQAQNTYFGVGAGSSIILYYGTDDTTMADEVRYGLALSPLGGFGVAGQVDFITNFENEIESSSSVDTYWGYGLNGYFFQTAGVLDTAGVTAFGIGGGVLVGADFAIDESISVFADLGVGINIGGVSAFGLDLGLPIVPAGRGALGIKFKM